MFSADKPGGGWSVGNSWQGSFPTENSLEDGYAGLAPATAFAPNALGVRLPHDSLSTRSRWRPVAFKVERLQLRGVGDVRVACLSVLQQLCFLLWEDWDSQPLAINLARIRDRNIPPGVRFTGERVGMGGWR